MVLPQSDRLRNVATELNPRRGPLEKRYTLANETRNIIANKGPTKGILRTSKKEEMCVRDDKESLKEHIHVLCEPPTNILPILITMLQIE